MQNEKWYCDGAVSPFVVLCEGCKTPTSTEMTVRFIAGLCGMSDLVCERCGRVEGWGTVKAVLSTTVLPKDGTYRVETLRDERRENALKSLSGVAHYIGHPDTKKIVESLGAVPAPTKLFAGLEVGEQAICFPIKQGLSSRAVEGFTSPHQAIEEIATLDVRVITRIE